MDDKQCNTCKHACYDREGDFLGCFALLEPKNAPVKWPEVDPDDLCDEWENG